jgi:hypothetical protein
MKFTTLLVSSLVGTVYARCGCENSIGELIEKAREQTNTLNEIYEKTQQLEQDQASCQASDLETITALKTKLAALRAQKTDLLGQYTVARDEVTKKITNMSPSFNSVKLGDRWVIQPESDIALVFRDLKTGGDKRYAFYNGGHSDMYQAGHGGEVVASRFTFPSRWSIQEESGTYLVLRDRAVPGRDFRYAMSASKYVDL